MLDPAKFILFIAVAWALIITPGPDMLYVLTRGMAHGRKAGMVSAVGVISGVLIHTLGAALGVSLIFQASSFAFLIMKYLGMTYLIYLGIKAWMDKSAFELSTTGAKPQSLFWQGVLSNVLNPKIAIFFLAFLPQFVNYESDHIPLQMITLGLTFALFGFCFLVTVGYFAGAVGAWLTRLPQYTNIFRWLSGGILLSLGVRIALTDQR